MKKIYLAGLLAAAAGAMSLNAANTGTGQLVGLQPSPGNVSLDVNQEGVASIIFNLRGGGDVNRSCTDYAELVRDGVVIARVDAGNTARVQYDDFYADVWTLSFFSQPAGRATVTGDYQIIIPEGFFLMGADKTPSELITIDYHVDGPKCLILPARGTYQQIDKITVTFPNYTKVEPNPAATGKATLFDSTATGEETEAVSFIPTAEFDGNMVVYTFDEPVTRGATWWFDIPADSFILTRPDGSTLVTNDTSFGDMGTSYVVPTSDQKRPTISPAEGFVDMFPGTLTLTIETGKVLVVNNMTRNYLYTVLADGSLGEKVASYIAYKDEENERNVLLKSMDGADNTFIPSPGKYRFVSGNMLFKTDQSNKFYPSFSWDFTVLNSGLVEHEVTPSKDVPVFSTDRVKITFPNASNVTVISETNLGGNIKQSVGPAMVTDGLVEIMAWPSYSEDDPKSVTYIMTRTLTTPGTFTLTSPLGGLNVDGMIVSIAGDFRITNDINPVAIDPEAGSTIEEFPMTFNVTLPEGREYDIDADMKAVMTSADSDSKAEPLLLTPEATDKGFKLTIAEEQKLEDGNYVLTLPAELYSSDLSINTGSEYEYIVKNKNSVEELAAEDGTFDVYTISGIAVMKGADAARVKELPAGLYIINGKKVILTD